MRYETTVVDKKFQSEQFAEISILCVLYGRLLLNFKTINPVNTILVKNNS
jgi:hypothetical protein